MAIDSSAPSGGEASMAVLWAAIRNNTIDLDTRMALLEALGLSAAVNEISAARGSKIDLDARLSVALSDTGALNFDTLRSVAYSTTGDTAVYVNATSFTVTGDRTLGYPAGILCRFNLGSGVYSYAAVQSSSYSSPNTTVTLRTGVLTATLAEVSIGVASLGREEIILPELSVKLETSANLLKVLAGSIEDDCTAEAALALREAHLHASWGTEGLGTSTRGNTSAFPERYFITLEASKLTIWDATHVTLEMWMVFDGGADTDAIKNINSNAITSLCFQQGVLYVGLASGGLSAVDFHQDRAYWYGTTGKSYYKGTVSERNDGLGQGAVQASGAIISNDIRGVAATVLSGAPVTAHEEIEITTVAVATAGGLSVINNDGTVADSTQTAGFTGVTFDSTGRLWAGLTGSTYDVMAGTVFAADGFDLSTQDYLYKGDGSSSAPPLVTTSPYQLVHEDAMGSSAGLTLFEHDAVQAQSLVAHITNNYNTGWMCGATVLAALIHDETGNTESEKVVNGSFTTDTVWTKGTGWTIGAGVAPCDGSQVSTTDLSQTITTTLGKMYAITYTVSSYVAGTVTPLIGAVAGAARSANGTYTDYIIAAVGGTESIIIQGDASFDGTLDNVSMSEAIIDRSGKGNHLKIEGALVRARVASGTDQVDYSAWSNTIYGRMPYNAALDFASLPFWSRVWVEGNAASGYVLERDSSSTAANWSLQVIVTTGIARWTLDDGTTTITIDSLTDVADGEPHCIDFVGDVTGSSLLYIDGKLEATVATSALGSLTNTSAVLTLGNNTALASAYGGSASLLKLGTTVPTATQIEFMYNQERRFFNNGTKCHLTGTTSAILDLDHDHYTDEVLVAASGGASRYVGLVRTSTIEMSTNANMTSDNVVSLSQKRGAYVAATDAESVGFIPEANIRRIIEQVQDDRRFADTLDKNRNLSDVANLTTAKANLGITDFSAVSGIIETNANLVDLCKFGPSLDGTNWDEKTAASTAPLMIATVETGGVGSELTTNGGFDTDTAWSKGTGWTISAGAAHIDGIGAGDLSEAYVGFRLGETYRLEYTVSNYVSGGIRVLIYGNGCVAIGTTRTANGTYSQDVTLTAGGSVTDFIVVQSVTDPLECTVDNVSVKKLGAEINIWDATATPIASSTPLATLVLAGAQVPTSIAGAGGKLIIGCEAGVKFVGVEDNAWAELFDGWPRALSTTTAPALDSNNVVMVAAGYADASTLDPRTGGPTPTFGALYAPAETKTAALIKHDGNVWDITGASPATGVIGFHNHDFIFPRSATEIRRLEINKIVADIASSSGDSYMDSAGTTVQGFAPTTDFDAHGNMFAVASTGGLNISSPMPLGQSRPNDVQHGVASMTRLINTGLLYGDIRGAWLSSTALTSAGETDRSYGGVNLTKNGAPTVAAVAAGAELDCYSGLTTSVNYTAASNAKWDVITTGAVYQSIWVKSAGCVASEALCGYANAGGTIRNTITWSSTNGDIAWEIQGAGGTGTFASARTGLDDGYWHKIDCVQESSVLRHIYIDGVLDVTSTTDVGSLTGTGALPYAIGRLGGSAAQGATTSSLFEAHISASAPSAAQVKAMYEAEKGRVVAGTKCTLQSATTDAVLDVDIDAITGFVTVVQTDDETVWKGLAIHSEPTVPTGGTTWEHSLRHGDRAFTITNANLYGSLPAISLRQTAAEVEGLMAKLPAGVNLGEAKAWIYLNMSSGAIIASKNIAYVTDDGPGAFTAYFAVPFKSTGYAVSGAGGKQSSSTESINITPSGNQPGHCSLGWTNSAGTGIDTQNFFAVFHGELENE